MITRRFRDDCGASAVELALVSPILVLMLMGIVQFGFTFFQYLEVSHAAREGVRWASLGTEAGSVGETASVRGRTAAAAPGLVPALGDANISISVNGTGSENPDPLGGDGGKPVSVTVSYPSPIFLPLMPEILGRDTILLESTAVQRIEG